MAALTTRQEYDAIRTAIQTLTTTGQSIVSFSLEGIQITFSQSQLTWLQEREIELARRLSVRNIRKRTLADFSSADDTVTV